jgi:molybdopterin converting factor small subunit
MVLVKFLSALRDQVGVASQPLILSKGSTLRTVSEHLGRHCGLKVPADDIIATLNGHGWTQTAEGLDTPLADGDVIHLFPPVAGG